MSAQAASVRRHESAKEVRIPTIGEQRNQGRIPLCKIAGLGQARLNFGAITETWKAQCNTETHYARLCAYI